MESDGPAGEAGYSRWGLGGWSPSKFAQSKPYESKDRAWFEGGSPQQTVVGRIVSNRLRPSRMSWSARKVERRLAPTASRPSQ